MVDITQISKCEFEDAYNKHSPSKLEKFFFKYFSSDASLKDKWLKWIFIGILFIPFILGLIGTISGASINFVQSVTFIFCVLLIAFAIPWMFVWSMHKCRIKKIQKELGINRFEYDFLIDKYYDNTTNAVTYIKNKICR